MTLAPRHHADTARRPLRLGFVGLGWIGRARLEALRQQGVLGEALLHDRDADACSGVECGRTCASLDDLLAHGPDGVVIATPNMVHAEQCLAALRRGVPVFCQKPLAPTAEDARRVVREAQERDLPLAVDWSYRHLRGVRWLERSLEKGLFGRLVGLDLTFHNAWGPDGAWFYDRALAGGGCLVDLGVHLLDLAHRVAGPLECRAAHIAAEGRPVPAGPTAPVEDFAWAQLEGRAGAGVRLACSWRAHAGRACAITLELHGTDGGARIANIGDSFLDFQTHHHTGTRSRLVLDEDGAWGGGAIGAWARRVADGGGFEPRAHAAVAVAELIERVYARAGVGGVPCAC